MKILMVTIPFAPSRGGVQTVVELISGALAAKSHEVCVATLQPSNQPDHYPFKVLRRPKPPELIRAFLRADKVVLHGSIIRLGWPLLFIPSRVWMVHHMWPEKERFWFAPFARMFLQWRCRHLVVSKAFSASVDAPTKVIPNPYDNAKFICLDGAVRDRDLIFVGRLIIEKGVDLLIDSLALMAAQGIRPSVTIVGDGKEDHALKAQVNSLGLESQVRFVGEKSRDELVPLLNQHRVLVIPSRWEEPFGIVALEGLACGCAIVSSDAGGLPEAVGSCGRLFSKGNAQSLADSLVSTLTHPISPGEISRESKDHLARHTPEAVAQSYLAFLGA